MLFVLHLLWRITPWVKGKCGSASIIIIMVLNVSSSYYYHHYRFGLFFVRSIVWRCLHNVSEAVTFSKADEKVIRQKQRTEKEKGRRKVKKVVWKVFLLFSACMLDLRSMPTINNYSYILWMHAMNTPSFIIIILFCITHLQYYVLYYILLLVHSSYYTSSCITVFII
jgi:hypothetical protein